MLEAWNSFYVMIGSSAAALTGLMFVVITLVNDRRSATHDGISTFSTPTVFHFCCVLLTAAFMSAPFRSLVPVAMLLGLAGLGGLVYVVRIAARTVRLETYRPDAEDWTWHVILPFAAYASLATGAVALHVAASPALFAPAFGVTLLIFVGIHNAWDVVTFLAISKADALPELPASAEAPDKASDR